MGFDTERVQVASRTNPWVTSIAAASIGLAAAFLVGIGSASATAQSAGDSISVWDGVYTEAQASRGRPIFNKECGECHQASDFGVGFTTVYEFFASRNTMPEMAPGAISPEDYVDLTAYVLNANEYPAGKQELKPDKGVLEKIRIGPKP